MYGTRKAQPSKPEPHKAAALLDVISAPQEPVMTPTTTWDEAHKFGVFMLKAVLDGGCRTAHRPGRRRAAPGLTQDFRRCPSIQ
jgi:hypothetical protein